ncbi:hypothetical protein AAVH_11766 [Aphelenchoides avenae]|nr:hypothetical protein AAVH_11766 [Aphelenchus avenae]
MNRNRLAGISEALEENGNAKARPRAHSAHPQATQLTPKKNGTLELNYQQIEKMEAEGKDLLAMIMGGDSSSPPQKKAKTEISPVPVPSPPGRVPSTSTGWQQHPGSRGAMPQPGHGHVPIQHGRPGTGPTPHMNGKYPPDVKFAHGIGKISPNGFSPPPGTSWPGPAPTGLSFKHKQAQFCNPNIAGNNLLAAANAQAQQFRAQHDDRRQQYHQQHNHHEQKVFNRFGHHDHGGPPTPMPGAFGGHHIRGHGPPPRPHWQRPHGGHASRLDGRLHYSATRPGPRQPFHHGRTPNHRSPPRQGGPPRHRSPSRGRQSQPRSLVPLFDIDVKPEPPILLTVDDTPQGCGHDVLQNGEQNAASNHTKVIPFKRYHCKSVKPELLSEFDEPQASNEVDTQQQQASDGKRREGQPYRIPKKKRAPAEPPAPMLPDVQYFEPDERAASPGLEFYQPDEQSLEQRDEQFFEADEPTPSTSSAGSSSRPITGQGKTATSWPLGIQRAGQSLDEAVTERRCEGDGQEQRKTDEVSCQCRVTSAFCDTTTTSDAFDIPPKNSSRTGRPNANTE